MDKIDWLAEKLPEKPDEGLHDWLYVKVYDEGCVGRPYIIYQRESIPREMVLKRTMTPEDYEELETKGHTWGARCTCSNCEETFFTRYVRGGGIMMHIGDDDQSYTVLNDDYEATEFLDCENVVCPFCGSVCELVRKKDMYHQRTEQLLVAAVQEVEGYMAVIYWMVTRTCTEMGHDDLRIWPRDAIVVDREGKVRRFTHSNHGQFGERKTESWRLTRSVREPSFIRYYSWEASCHNKIGNIVYDDVPDLTGTTGEKTAIEAYVENGGESLGVYLMTWRRHPNVENLLRSQIAAAVVRGMEWESGYMNQWGQREVAELGWVDWNHAKPNRMVHMGKADWRSITPVYWTETAWRAWRLYQQLGGRGTGMEFEEAIIYLTDQGVKDTLEMTVAGWENFELRKVAKYLRKQEERGANGVRLLIDYRKAVHTLRIAETEEVAWPRHLVQAHDQMTELVLPAPDHHRDKATKAAFEETFAALRGLEWTDGELCILVPQCEQELVQEGSVLRHCVGGYGKIHCAGKPIFFVRHYRRPERSYYTLNIDLTTPRPHEIQLHGYGNERHGATKQYKHTIPKKVRAFCDRWEKEVLYPWARERLEEKMKKFKEAMTA